MLKREDVLASQASPAGFRASLHGDASGPSGPGCRGAPAWQDGRIRMPARSGQQERQRPGVFDDRGGVSWNIMRGS